VVCDVRRPRSVLTWSCAFDDGGRPNTGRPGRGRRRVKLPRREPSDCFIWTTLYDLHTPKLDARHNVDLIVVRFADPRILIVHRVQELFDETLEVDRSTV
jgi:hypothetical protein